MAQHERQHELNIREYLQIVSRRRWIIYTCVLVATLAATAASFIATPVYQATCTISIERAGVRILRQDLTSAQPSWLDYQNFYNTQYKIIESDRVLRLAVEQLDLPSRPGLLGEEKSSLSQAFSRMKSSFIHTISRSRVSRQQQDALRGYVGLIRGGLTVSPVRESFLVNISYVSPDPELAAEIANAVADAYRYFTLSEKMDVATQSTDWFVEQIDSLKTEVGALEYELQEYGRRHKIVLGEEGAVSRQNFQDLRQKLSQAQAETATKHARMDAIRTARPESLDEVRQNALIREMTRELTDLRSKHDELRSTFGPDYPEVKTISAKIDSQTKQLEDETQKIAQRIYAAAVADYEQALGEEKYLAQLLDRTKDEVEKEDRAMGEYMTKKSELDQKRRTLEDLLTRQNEMTLSAALGDTAHNVRVIDFAEVPTSIFKPKKKLNIMIGFLFGLFLGIGAAVLMEFVDNTLKTPDDVRAVLGGVPVLGLIPSQSTVSRTGSRKQKRARQRAQEEIEPALVAAKVPLSPIAEAYRELRTALLLATPGHPPRDITVTSCQPSEGKTTTALNLAIGLSQLGRRVLVVDTDLRRPRCHQVLKVPATQGVSNFLTGLDEIDELIHPTEVERLFLLPAGPVPPNPAELLDSKRFLELQERLQAHDGFDHIVFDSPPVLSVVDPLLIGRHTDGTVLVVRSAFTSREAGRLGKEKLDSGRVNLLGVLLNAVETEHVPYQYRYYRYGYGHAAKKKPAEEAGGEQAGRAAAIGGSRGT